MQVSIVNFSEVRRNKSFRIDGDFWIKTPYKNPTLLYKRIGDYLKKSQYGLSISMNEDGNGYPIYRMNEIQNMLCNLRVSKFANISEADTVNFILENKDVVFNRTNSYEWVGRTGIYYKNDVDHIFASYLVRFVPNRAFILPEYLTAFLNTKYGVQDIKRRSRPSINQTNVNPEEVKEIEIPLLSIEFQKYIELFFSESNRARLIGHEVYQQAQDILLDELGLNDWRPKHQLWFIKHYSDTVEAERMDAEYFQPKYDDIINAIKSYKGGWDRLGNLVNIKKSIEVGSEQYLDEGIPFVRVSNLSTFAITEEKYISNELYQKLLSAHQPKKDEILLSKDGTAGIAHHLNEQPTKMIVSGGILRLMQKTSMSFECLTLILNSAIIQEQMKRDVGGSIIQHWRPEQIKQVMIPVISEAKQQEIQQKIQESIKLRKQSSQLLENAKIAVEMAIEQDEETAMNWLENQ